MGINVIFIRLKVFPTPTLISGLCLTFHRSRQHLRLREVECKMSKTKSSEEATFQKLGDEMFIPQSTKGKIEFLL